jgi:hypothetical protein
LPIPQEAPIKAFNTSLYKESYVAQINERAQIEIRKELITLLISSVESWKHADLYTVLLKTRDISKANEKTILEHLIHNSEETPIFDFEIAFT